MSRPVDVNAGGRLHPVVSIDDTRPDMRVRSATPPRVLTPSTGNGSSRNVAEVSQATASTSSANAGTSPAQADSSRADSQQVSDKQRLDELCSQAERDGTAEAWARATPFLYARLREMPGDVQAWIRLACGALAQGRESEAVRAAQEAIKLKPSANLGHVLSAWIAQKFIDAGEWETAIQFAEAALASRPSDMDMLELLAKALFKKGVFDRAEAALGILAHCSSDRSAALACEFAKDSTSSAVRRHHWLTLASSWGRGSERPLRELGEVCLLLQRDQEAIHWFHKVVAQNPTEVEVALKLAQMHLRGGHGVEEALQVYRNAARATPDHYMLHRQYGQLLLKERRASEAAEIIRIAARLAPPNETSSLYIALAELQQSMGLIPEALRAWDAAVALDEGNIPAWRGLASAAAVSGQDRTQLRALKQLHGREPQNAEWLAKLGSLQARMNSPDEARKDFARALKLNSSHPSALLGLAQLSSGAEALDLFERAARADPTCEAAVAGAMAARQQLAQQKQTLASSISTDTTESGPGSTASVPAIASSETWREEIADGQPIEVYSKSAGSWIPGSVMQRSGDMIKLKYSIDGKWCEKVLLKASENLRLPNKPSETPSPSAEATKNTTSALAAQVAGGSQVGERDVGAQRSLTRSMTPPRVVVPAASASPISKATSSEAGKATVMQDPPCKPSPSATPAQSIKSDQAGRAVGGYPSGEPSVGAQRSSTRSVTPPRTPRAVIPATGAEARKPSSTRSVTPPRAAEATKPKGTNSDARKGVVAEDPPQKPLTTSTPTRSSKAGMTAELLEPSELQFGKAIGTGGFGAVFHGTYRGEEVAIKKLHVLDGMVTQLQLEEFKKEVGNLQALRHERLVRFIGAAYVSPSLCIVTEYMPNGSLYHLLHQRKHKLTMPQRHDISVQIAEGVDFLHSKTPPFVHRDLKSLNVVLSQALSAKLCDFGLTQSMEKTHISRRENEGGSPRYMAPEVFDSKGKITEKVDVWALGCLALEVHSGRVPHEECTTIQQVMVKTLVDRSLPFIDFSGLHPELRSLAELCFVFDPRQRIGAPYFLEVLRALNPERSSSGR